MKKIAIGIIAVLTLALFLAPTVLFADGNEIVPYSFGPRFMNGNFYGHMGPGMMMGRGFGGYGLSWQVADILKMDVNDVLKEVQAGKSYAEIAKAKGLSSSQLQEKLLAAHKVTLDEYVKAGFMTPEQVKFIQENMAIRIKYMIDYKYDSNTSFGFRGRGFGGCWGGGFGPRF
ncbi:MAG: hypothetical protein PWQ67_2527 [Clostridia bacterium]|nr:hypothetical protein [Clostridia bacterium]MDN5324073.1 hypothetical protein [Clostridia bacterium]